MLNIKLYQQYLHQYLKEAVKNSDASVSGIQRYLSDIRPPGRFAMHKKEKTQALADAKRAFEEHRHWPLEIILSQLGVDAQEIRGE